MQTPTEPDDDRKTISGALMASGFPFQLAVRDLVSACGWHILEEEFPWPSQSGRDEFLDMVADIAGDVQPVILSIECKKTTKESFVFLLTQPERQRSTDRFSGVGTRTIKDSNPRLVLPVGVWTLFPESAEADFCVVAGVSNPSERLLEKDAQKLVRATDAFARSFRDGRTKAGKTLQEGLFIPLLVTNAHLYTSEFSPLKVVSLTTGAFTAPPPDAKSIDFIRFRKAFVSGAETQPSERSVFVVHVEALKAFLKKVGLALRNPADNAWILR